MHEVWNYITSPTSSSVSMDKKGRTYQETSFGSNDSVSPAVHRRKGQKTHDMEIKQGLPENWGELEMGQKLEQIMLTVTKIDFSQQGLLDQHVKREQDFSQLSLKVKQLEGKNAHLEKDLDQLKTQNLELTQRSMQNNLLFNGLREARQENCEDLVIHFLRNNMNVPAADIYGPDHPMGEIRIDLAHRNGKKREGVNAGPRPIVVRFVTRKGKLLVFKYVRQLKGTAFSVSDQLPPLIREQRSAQVTTLNDLRGQYKDKSKDNIRLVYNKLYHNKDIVPGEFELNSLPASNFDAMDWDYNDMFHTEVAEHEHSHFQGHCIQITSIEEACKARDALFQSRDISKSDHIMYVYRFIDLHNKLVEGYSDDGEVRGSKQIRKTLDRLKMENIFVAVSRIHDGPNIGQKRFDMIREATEGVVKLLLDE